MSHELHPIPPDVQCGIDAGLTMGRARRDDEPPATDAQMPLPLLAALVLLVALLVFVAGLSIGWVAHGDAQRVTAPNKPVPVPATWRSA